MSFEGVEVGKLLNVGPGDEALLARAGEPPLTASSEWAWWNAWLNSWITRALSALSLSGRLMVMTAMPSSIS